MSSAPFSARGLVFSRNPVVMLGHANLFRGFSTVRRHEIANPEKVQVYLCTRIPQENGNVLQSSPRLLCTLEFDDKEKVYKPKVLYEVEMENAGPCIPVVYFKSERGQFLSPEGPFHVTLSLS